jgi:cytochrome c oxidase subunit 2
MITGIWPRLLALLPLALTACATSTETRAEELYGYCQHCHGTAGEGNVDFRAPSIAGMSEWYVHAQIEKFRVGARGDHPDDLDGLRMRPMSRTLATAAEVRLVAHYVASMEPTHPATIVEGGDPNRGRTLYEPCVQCHGENAQGRRDMNAPELSTQSDWYLVVQLEKFRTGVRGADPLDTTGAQMRGMVGSLEDEQAVRDVVAYVTSLQ